MKRKAGALRPEPDHGRVTPAGALRLAVSRAAQEALRAALKAGDVAEARLTLPAIAEALPQAGLWVALRGPGAAAGLVTLDASLLAAVLQAQTTGRITGSSVAERAPTQTDAILARRFLTLLLETFALRLEGTAQARWASGFQARDRVADPARLPHLMPDTVYRGFSAAVEIAGGLRQGRLDLILPQEPAGEAAAADPAASEPDPRRAAWQGALAQKVLDSPAALEAVLHRLEMPLADLSRLRPDMLLPLPPQAIATVSLEGADGRRAGVARLGQTQGRRAVKLISVPGPREDEAGEARSGPGGGRAPDE